MSSWDPVTKATFDTGIFVTSPELMAYCWAQAED